MANTFHFIDGGGTSHSIYVAGASTARFVVRDSEEGAEHPPQEARTDGGPSRLAQRYRETVYQPRIYGYKCTLKNTSAASLSEAIRSWEAWHDPELGEGYIYRVAYDGTTRCLDCVPQGGEWEPPEGHSRTVHQTYKAANPWWRGTTATTESLSTSNSATAYVTTSNAGDIPAYTSITITGIVKYPKITVVSTGHYIEVRKSTSAADDEIRIVGTPDAYTTKFYANGAGAGVHVPITGGSRYITLPTGSHSASLACTSTSGTVSAVISHYDYYRSL
jgi:hypothetical protein